MWTVLLKLLLFSSTTLVANCDYNNLPPDYDPSQKVLECEAEKQTCTFSIVVEALESMTFYQYEGSRRKYEGFRAYFDKENSMFKTLLSKSGADPIANMENVQPPIITDGHFRPIFTINGQMPGPTIVANTGQTLILTVYNELKNNEGISIHWHGMHQKYTSLMDGVPYITQYPILPNQYMVYNFTASPSGTHWYHAHGGTQRTDGIYGALIVKDSISGMSVIDDYESHTLILMDWSKDPSHRIAQEIISSLLFWKEPADEQCLSFESTKGPDYTTVGPFPFWSGIINDKGRHCELKNNKADCNLNVSALNHFNVSADQLYRFRLIGAQSAYAFKFSIQDHNLTVVATDGNQIEPINNVQYLIVNSGERYDVIVNTSGHDIKEYWMLAQTLEMYPRDQNFFSPLSFHKAEAVLHYEGANELLTDSESSHTWDCSSDMICNVVNCPFATNSTVTRMLNWTCINAHDFKSDHEDPIPSEIHEPYETFFYNFDFDGECSTNGSSIDGINFRFPPHPPIGGYEKFKTMKSKHICPGRGCPHRLANSDVPFCACLHQIDLSSVHENKTVEIVISNINADEGERRCRGSSHPVHLHGHTFYVVKTGYPTYDETGQIESYNRDVVCNELHPDGDCQQAFNTITKFIDNTEVQIQEVTWSSSTIGSISTMNKKLSQKDTVIVPYGGYVVIRFIVDNPGWWFFHCHIEIHQLEGMSAVVTELPGKINYNINPNAMIPTSNNESCDLPSNSHSSKISLRVIYVIILVTATAFII